MTKTEQLQLRVSAREKEQIRALAALAGEDVSKWVLRKLLPVPAEEFQILVNKLGANSSPHSLALAELHDFLQSLTTTELEAAVQNVALHDLGAFESNYVAAMIEFACHSKGIPAPGWLLKIPSLPSPWFASELKSLRLHLLTSSPVPFRRRNLFIDSTLGARV